MLMILKIILFMSTICFFTLSLILTLRVLNKIAALFLKDEQPSDKIHEEITLENMVENNKHKKTDIPESIMEKISAIVGQTVRYPCPVMIKDSFVFSWGDKKIKDGKTVDCRHINFHWHFYNFNEFNVPFFKVIVEKHYGDPIWDGKDMHYNYDIIKNEYYVSLHEIENFWKKVESDVLCINLKKQPFPVKNGNTSYFNNKQYGHLFANI